MSVLITAMSTPKTFFETVDDRSLRNKAKSTPVTCLFDRKSKLPSSYASLYTLFSVFDFPQFFIIGEKGEFVL